MWGIARDEPHLVQYVRRPNFEAHQAGLEKLLTLAGEGRLCWSAYVLPVAHVRRELTPRWHDKRGTLVATAVCHKKHENEIDGCEAWTENNRQPLANDRFSTCRTGCAWHVLARRSKRSPDPKSAQSTRRP